MSTPHPESLPQHIRHMLKPAFYPHPVKTVTLIQTHISWVFIAGDYAYKIKKPVNLGFLDFSTLKLRHAACDKELLLNQRLAPDLYIRVIPIGTENEFLEPVSGEITDYCLQMHAFDQSMLFSSLIHTEDFQQQWIDQLATDIANFHQHAPQHQSSPHSPLDTMTQVITDEIHRYKQPSDLLEPRLDSWKKLARLRQQQGKVREVHGDLHLNNLVLYQAQPMAFDCIEFNDDLRIIDTLSDAAFLTMDCEAAGKPEFGWQFISRYLEATWDYQGLCILPLFLCYRAMVRSRVSNIQALAAETSSSEKDVLLKQAKLYFQLGLSYLGKTSPALYMIGGLSGSGKSHLARCGCGPLRAIIIRSDAVRKQLHQQHPEYSRYAQALTNLTYQQMMHLAKPCIQAGFSVILDATFLEEEHRALVTTLASQLDIPLHRYWLELPEDTLRKRLNARSRDNTDISEADTEVLAKQLQSYQRPEEQGITFLNSSQV